MLNIIKISKQSYDALSEEEKNNAETIYLCKDTKTLLGSIYVQGQCYGEDINEDDVYAKIQTVQDQVNNIDEEDIYTKIQEVQDQVDKMEAASDVIVADNSDIAKMFQ